MEENALVSGSGSGSGSGLVSPGGIPRKKSKADKSRWSTAEQLDPKSGIKRDLIRVRPQRGF